MWSQELGAHIGHGIGAMTGAQAPSSLTGNVAEILLGRVWWVAWDPRGPIPILELGECIPPWAPDSPHVSAISLCPISELRKTTSTDHFPRHRPGPVGIRSLSARRPGIAALFRPKGGTAQECTTFSYETNIQRLSLYYAVVDFY